MSAGDVVGTNMTALTLTGLTSLPAGGWWASAMMDWADAGYLDMAYQLNIKLPATVSVAGIVEVFAYGSGDGTYASGGLDGTTRPGVITWGTGCSELGYQDVRRIGFGSIGATDDADLLKIGPCFVVPVYGRFLPKKGGILVRNGLAEAFDATGTGNVITPTNYKIAQS